MEDLSCVLKERSQGSPSIPSFSDYLLHSFAAYPFKTVDNAQKPKKVTLISSAQGAFRLVFLIYHYQEDLW